jgi:hypothetical protein
MTLTLGTMAWCGTPLSALSQKMPGLAAADYGPGDHKVRKAAQPSHGLDNGRHVVDLALGEMAGLGPGIGDDFLALTIVEFLRDRKGLICGPTPALAAGLLQRRQIKQTRWGLPAMLDGYGQRAGMPRGGLGDSLG